MRIRTICTFQVDNPLLRLARPELLGHHALAEAEMSNLAIRKLGPGERMGVFATVDGRTALVEYSDLPEELAEKRDPDGDLVFWAGSPAVHCLEVGFVERLTAPGGSGLPFHRADKKVPHVGRDGTLVQPDAPNAVKFEAFIFDALPLAERTVTVESLRSEDFSPIKNAEGADSPPPRAATSTASTPGGSSPPASRSRATPTGTRRTTSRSIPARRWTPTSSGTASRPG